MNEDLNNVLLRLIQENIQTNKQWTDTAVQFLNVLGNAIQEDTEYMRQSIDRIEAMISRFSGQKNEELTMYSDQESIMQPLRQERYPASFYFRHPYPDTVEMPEYYLVVEQEEDHLVYSLYDKNGAAVRVGMIEDSCLQHYQIISIVSDQAGLGEYMSYEAEEDILARIQISTDESISGTENKDMEKTAATEAETVRENEDKITKIEAETAQERGKSR